LENNIKAKRDELGITQTELAKRLQISRHHMNKIERGEKNISIKLAARIANHLNCRISDIFLP
jgi:putative transcriptional regulator